MTPVAFERPDNWLELGTIDAHTEGEPLRVIVSGFPEPEGATMLAKREYSRTHHDSLRKALMWEPRGHADMYGCLPTRAATHDGDVGVLFLHNEGYSTMCGHGIIAIVKVGIECGLFRARQGQVRIDTPAGRVTATPHMRGDRVESVSFRNVPSFLLEPDLSVEVEGMGRVKCDIAFGGAFYAYTDGAALGLDSRDVRALIDVGMRIKHAVMNQYTIVHPEGDPALSFLYGTVFVWPGHGDLHSTNVCIFADGEVDRSPTGTGVSGRAAIAHAKGELDVGPFVEIASIIGSRFGVRVAELTRVGAVEAIVPEVRGRAFITGKHTFWVDPSDPLREGFLLR
jgi:trans-L-3-hydroxyproline dehydratase